MTNLDHHGVAHPEFSGQLRQSGRELFECRLPKEIRNSYGDVRTGLAQIYRIDESERDKIIAQARLVFQPLIFGLIQRIVGDERATDVFVSFADSVNGSFSDLFSKYLEDDSGYLAFYSRNDLGDSLEVGQIVELSEFHQKDYAQLTNENLPHGELAVPRFSSDVSHRLDAMEQRACDIVEDLMADMLQYFGRKSVVLSFEIKKTLQEVMTYLQSSQNG